MSRANNTEMYELCTYHSSNHYGSTILHFGKQEHGSTCAAPQSRAPISPNAFCSEIWKRRRHSEQPDSREASYGWDERLFMRSEAPVLFPGAVRRCITTMMVPHISQRSLRGDMVETPSFRAKPRNLLFPLSKQRIRACPISGMFFVPDMETTNVCPVVFRRIVGARNTQLWVTVTLTNLSLYKNTA
jgi:hypothetical protein